MRKVWAQFFRVQVRKAPSILLETYKTEGQDKIDINLQLGLDELIQDELPIRQSKILNILIEFDRV